MTGVADGNPVLAVLAAFLAATIIAFATAVQQRATRRAPAGRGLQLAMLAALARDPRWLASLVGIGIGFGLYLVALSHGALALSQPIMVSGVVLGTVFSARLARRSVDRGLLLGGGLCAAGLAVLLGVARPTSGHYAIEPGTDLTATGWLAACLGAVLVATALAAMCSEGLVRAIMLALAAGLLFGVNAALAKLVAEQLARGWQEPLSHWPLFAIVLTASAGFTFSQRAMQLGRLLAPVNAIISTADPLTAVVIGVVAFGERIVVTPSALVAECAAAAAVVAGLTVVTRRGAQLLDADHVGSDRQRTPVGWG